MTQPRPIIGRRLFGANGDRPLWRVALGVLLTLVVVHLVKSAYPHLFQQGPYAMALNNQFEVATWIAMEGLDRLINTLGVANHFKPAWAEEFQREFPVGDTVQVPLPTRFLPTRGLAYNPQPVVRKHTTVTMSNIVGVHFDIDSVEQALRVGRSKDWIRANLLNPAVEQIRQEIDSDAAQFAYQNCPNIAGVLGTNPTAYDTYSAAARRILVESACPQDRAEDGGWDVGAFVPPVVNQALKNASIGYFNPQNTLSRQWRAGIIAEADAATWYESMSLYDHTAGTLANAAGITVKTASNSGDTTLVVNCTTGDTFNQGDVYAIGGRYFVNPMTRRKANAARNFQFVVTAPATGASSAATLSIYPAILGPGDPYQNIDTLPAVNDTLTLFPGTSSPSAKAGKQGLFIHPNAYMIVGAPLEKPTSAEAAGYERDPDTGLAIRYTKSWDPIQSRMIYRLETLYGFGVGFSENCAVRGLSA